MALGGHGAVGGGEKALPSRDASLPWVWAEDPVLVLVYLKVKDELSFTAGTQGGRHAIHRPKGWVSLPTPNLPRDTPNILSVWRPSPPLRCCLSPRAAEEVNQEDGHRASFLPSPRSPPGTNQDSRRR